MTGPEQGWMAERSPAPAFALEGAPRGVDGMEAEARVGALWEVASEGLGAARSEPGRVRASAFHLLAADAWLTYACEAALECPDADAVLKDMVRSVVRDG